MPAPIVGIVGGGRMGTGIAQLAATHGYNVRIIVRDERAFERCFTALNTALGRALEKGRINERLRDHIKKHVRVETSAGSLSDADIVIEAIPEGLELKQEVFRELEKVCGEQTIFATNTSSLPVREIMNAVKRKERCVGTHFFNPAPVVKLVEVVGIDETSDETFDRVGRFLKKLHKTAVVSKDLPGFIVNWLLIPYLLQAVKAFEEGRAAIADIDRGAVLGLQFPMGPLQMLDYIGLDTVLKVAENMHKQDADVNIPETIVRMVEQGKLGYKASSGFYDYSGGEPVPNDEQNV